MRGLILSDWVCGITAAPRSPATLPRCVDSMRKCGWEPVVFAEPGAVATDCVTIQNRQRRGCWHNWLFAARWCLEHSAAPVVLLVQDDALFHPDSKTFTESILWPSSDAGFVSLYMSKAFYLQDDCSKRPAGVNEIIPNSLWGACAIAWPRDVLSSVIDLELAKNWLGARVTKETSGGQHIRERYPELIPNSDTFMGRACRQLGRKMYFIHPSAVQHIATASTIGHGTNSGVMNCYKPADHAIPLADQAPKPARLVDIQLSRS